MATWRALVLGGGGSTGEFQMGALPVLARAVPRFDFYAGVAGGSVPLMLPPVEILGQRFVEGGLRDFIPLGLAVEAFRRAYEANPALQPEFFIVDNYTREVQHEAADLLSGGAPLVLRSIKI